MIKTLRTQLECICQTCRAVSKDIRTTQSSDEWIFETGAV